MDEDLIVRLYSTNMVSGFSHAGLSLSPDTAMQQQPDPTVPTHGSGRVKLVAGQERRIVGLVPDMAWLK